MFEIFKEPMFFPQSEQNKKYYIPKYHASLTDQYKGNFNISS